MKTATWIADDGSHKVTVVSTVDRGQHVTVETWSGSGWMLADRITPPPSLMVPAHGLLGEWLIAKLSRYVDPATLIEVPHDDDDNSWLRAGTAARWIPERAER